MATIAQVLHKAADHFLLQPGVLFSCTAVMWSADKYDVGLGTILDGLENMGLDTNSGHQFDDVKDPMGARYMWLKFAALIAEEQGV